MSEFYNQVWKPIFENGSLFLQPHFPPVPLVPQASRLLLLLCTLLALTTHIPLTHHILCRRYRPQCHCQKPRTSLCTPGWRRSIAQISSFHSYVGAICHYRVEHHIALPRLPPLTQRNRRSHFAFCWRIISSYPACTFAQSLRFIVSTDCDAHIIFNHFDLFPWLPILPLFRQESS